MPNKPDIKKHLSTHERTNKVVPDNLLVEVAKVGARGQIVIPASVRQSLKMKAGQKLLVFGDPKGGAVWVCPIEALEHLNQARGGAKATKKSGLCAPKGD